MKYVLQYLGFFLLAVLVYGNALHIPYYNDDFQRVFIHPNQIIFQGFITSNPYDHFYRPLEQVILSTIQMFWRWHTFPVRIVNLFMLAACAMLVYHVLRTWKIRTLYAILAGVLTIVLQFNVYAVAGNNTISQLLSTFFSSLSLWLLYNYFKRINNSRFSWKYLLSLCFFFLALLSKETSSSLLLIIPLVLLTLQKSRLLSKKSAIQLLTLYLPYVVFFVIYWLLRSKAGGSIPVFNSQSYYAFHFGNNILVNLGVFIGKTLLPVSTLTVLKLQSDHNYLSLLGIGIFTLITAIFIGYGLWKSKRKKMALLLSMVILIGWAPTIMLNYLTETYLFTACIALSILFGIAMQSLLSTYKNVRFTTIAINILFGLIIITNAIGVNNKVLSMKHEGERAKLFLPKVISYARSVPKDGLIYLVEPKRNRFEHSKFAMSHFDVLRYSDTLVSFYSQRPDVGLFFGDSLSCAVKIRSSPGIAITCDSLDSQLYPIKLID